MSEYKPMNGRPDLKRLRCETPEGQSIGGKRGGARTHNANELDAIWDEIIAHREATFRWIPPKVAQ